MDLAVIEFVELSPQLKRHLLDGDRESLRNLLLFPAAHEWIPEFGVVDRQNETWLNFLLVVFDLELCQSPIASSRNTGFAQRCKTGIGLALSQMCSQDSAFWEDYYVRRRFNAMWIKALPTLTYLSEVQFLQAMECFYDTWFIFIDAYFHLGSVKNPDIRRNIIMSSRNLLAGFHSLKYESDNDQLLTLLANGDPRVASHRLSAEAFFNEALQFSANLSCPGYQQLIMDQIALATKKP